jgi:hypothetical protein
MASHRSDPVLPGISTSGNLKRNPKALQAEFLRYLSLTWVLIDPCYFIDPWHPRGDRPLATVVAADPGIRPARRPQGPGTV